MRDKNDKVTIDMFEIRERKEEEEIENFEMDMLKLQEIIRRYDMDLILRSVSYDVYQKMMGYTYVS
jgi:hypothetical protein